jgi:anaerobic ribonucleoside-triphosphate reductase
MNNVKKCIKRNGVVDNFDRNKIQNAIRKSFLESKEGNKFIAKKITNLVLERIDRTYMREIPSVEEIQDIIEDTLMTLSFKKTAKLYILYRKNRSEERDYDHYFNSTDGPYL